MSSKIIVTNYSRSGRELRWRRIWIRKSLDSICHALELVLPPSERPNVRRHDRIQVRIANPLITDSGGRRLVTTALVDEVETAAGASGHSVTVLGRSPARDIVDSTWSDDRWVNPETTTPHTLAEIVGSIAEKFGIDFAWLPTDVPDPTGHVNFFAWQNETPWQKIITEADSQEFLFTSNGAGGLHLWRVAHAPRVEGFHVTEGQNARSITLRENGAEQFHRYVVTGNFEEVEEAVDHECPPGRVMTIDMTGFDVTREKMRNRALLERNRRREVRAAVAVSGWGLSDGQIAALGDTAGKYVFWGPNFMVPVRAPTVGLDEPLLVAEVEHEADHEAMQTTLTLTRRAAYLL